MDKLTKLELIWLIDDMTVCIQEYSQPDIAYDIRDKLKLMLEEYRDE